MSEVHSLNSAGHIRLPIVMAVGAILIGFVIRGWDLNGTGYTADEVAELLSAKRPFADIVLDRDDDLFPPLYRVTLAAWLRLWRTDDAARWLNVLWGTVTLIVVWRAAVVLLGEMAAYWPTLLLAVNPFHVHFCREDRAYALYTLFASVMFWMALRLAYGNEWRSWFGLAAASAGAAYTHYYGIPLAATLWLIVIVAQIACSRWQRPIAATAIGVALLFPAPLLLMRALSDLPDERLVARFDVEALGYAYLSLATGFTVGPSMMELRSMPTGEGVRQFAPWLIAIGFAYAILGWWALRRLARRSVAVLATPLIVLIPLLGIAGNMAGLSFVYRYVAWMAVPYALLLGSGAAEWKRSRWARVGVIVLLVVNLTAICNRRYNERYAEEDFRAVAKRLRDIDPAHGPTLIASHYMGKALKYYVGDSRRLASFSIFAHHANDREARIAEFTENLDPGEAFWIVSQWLPADDVRRSTRDEVLRRFDARLEAAFNQTEIYSAAAP